VPDGVLDGTMLIPIAYAGHQMDWMDPPKPSYNIPNAIGSLILAYVAFHPFQIGFFAGYLELDYHLRPAAA
jgi:hypothetical protein